MSICSAKEDMRKTNADENVTDSSTPSQAALQISNSSSTTIISHTAKANPKVLNSDEDHST